MLKVLWQGVREKGEKILISSVFLSSLALAFLGGGLYKGDQGEVPHLVINVPDYQKAALEFKNVSPEAFSQPQEEAPRVEPVAAAVSGADISLQATDTQNCPYLGSKNSDKYHLATCGVAKRIKAANVRCFATPEIAEASGYKPGCLK
ncbi:MAG: hypothetical protein KIH67_002145 [Candidatus Moranbacteria bacterium]|nr:hypothetical protein [Candidatus Moranbacteria bacterium]